MLHVYKKPKSSPDDDLIPIGCLRLALPRLLDYYLHLAGRFSRSKQNGNYGGDQS